MKKKTTPKKVSLPIENFKLQLWDGIEAVYSSDPTPPCPEVKRIETILKGMVEPDFVEATTEEALFNIMHHVDDFIKCKTIVHYTGLARSKTRDGQSSPNDVRPRIMEVDYIFHDDKPVIKIVETAIEDSSDEHTQLLLSQNKRIGPSGIKWKHLQVNAEKSLWYAQTAEKVIYDRYQDFLTDLHDICRAVALHPEQLLGVYAKNYIVHLSGNDYMFYSLRRVVDDKYLDVTSIPFKRQGADYEWLFAENLINQSVYEDTAANSCLVRSKDEPGMIEGIRFPGQGNETISTCQFEYERYYNSKYLFDSIILRIVKHEMPKDPFYAVDYHMRFIYEYKEPTECTVWKITPHVAVVDADSAVDYVDAVGYRIDRSDPVSFLFKPVNKVRVGAETLFKLGMTCSMISPERVAFPVYIEEAFSRDKTSIEEAKKKAVEGYLNSDNAYGRNEMELLLNWMDRCLIELDELATTLVHVSELMDHTYGIDYPSALGRAATAKTDALMARWIMRYVKSVMIDKSDRVIVPKRLGYETALPF